MSEWLINETEIALVEKDVDESENVRGENIECKKKKQRQSSLASFFSKAKWMEIQHLQIFYVIHLDILIF